MDSPLCTQRTSGLGSSFLSATELEANAPAKIQQNESEEPENVPLERHTEGKALSTEVLIEQEETYRDGGRNTAWKRALTTPVEVCRAVYELDPSRNRFDENENSGAKELLVNRRSLSNLIEKVQCQTCDLGKDEDSERDQSSKSPNSKEKWKECGQIKPEAHTDDENVETNRSYGFGYFVRKLSDAYKDAGRRLQGTRDIIQNVGVEEVKVVLSQYVTMVSKELPRQLQPQPDASMRSHNKVGLVDCARNLPQKTSVSMDISRWPEGSVSSFRDKSPEAFHQRLVELPSVLSQLQTCSSQEILEKLESLSPQIQVGKLLSIFWVKTAKSKEPVPKPGCLLLTEKDMRVVSAGSDLQDTLVLFHHLRLLEIKKVQISLAGQHVRLTGCSEGDVLVVFTYSKELTQEFCKALLKAVAPGRFSEGTQSHPLLSDDLTLLSLDWTSTVPDIVLDSGLQVTSRFKRVLANLLYIVHGNMDGPGKPSLADVCPLLYTSVKVMNSTRVHQDTIFQLLLTDTHVVLLQEDGVFHPVPRGSSLVPVQPQFQGLELHKRSDVRRLAVSQRDGCLVVDVVFTTGGQKVESRLGSVQASSSSSDYTRQCHSWNFCFGCSSEAEIFINHLCTTNTVK